jgi:hypothetical protein
MRFKSRSFMFGSAFALVVSGALVTVARAAVVPSVTGLSAAPSGGWTSEGGNTLVVTGTGFFNSGTVAAVTSIQFGITANQTVVQSTNPCPPAPTSSSGCFVVNSDTQITVTTPGHPHTALPGDVTVTTPGGTSPRVVADQITFTANTPQPTSLSVHSGPAGGSITISPLTGSAEASAFDFATSVQFVPASGPTVTVSTHPCPTSGPVPSGGCFQESADLVKLTAPSTGFTYGTLYHVQVTTAGGTSPASSGDQFTFAAASFSPQGVGAPQVAVTPDGSTQLVFWKNASTNQLAEAWYTGVWNGPAGFPQLGALSSTPGVAVTKDGSTQLVFWQGPSGHLMEAWYTGVWNGPLDITNTYLGGHGILGSAPSVTTTKDGTQLVFWRGTDGHLNEAWFSGTWHGPVDFTSLGSLASAPSSTVTADGSTQLVFFQGTDGRLTEDWFTGVWNGPARFGAISSPPSVAVTPDGSTQLVFYKSAAGHLLETWYTGRWNGPVDFTTTAFGGTGLLTSSPSATVTVDGSTQIVFWQGSGNTLWEGWYAAGAWHGPVNYSG